MSLSTRIEAATAQLEADSAKLEQVVNGDANTTVVTDGGTVSSLLKLQTDVFGSDNALHLAFGFSFPDTTYSVSRKAGRFVLNKTATDLKPAATVTYYLNSGTASGSWGAGDNANDGLSKGSPKKSIATLIAALNASPPAGHVEFVLRGGLVYSSTDGFNNSTINFGLSVTVDGGELAWLPSGRAGTEFSLGSGAVYKRVGHTALDVYDFSRVGTYGEPTKLTHDETVYASEAAVYAGLAEDSWTMYASNCYLRVAGGGAPGKEVMTVGSAATTSGSLYSQDQNLYLSGLRLTGHGAAINWRSRGAANKRIVAYDVQAAGSNGVLDMWQLDFDSGYAFLELCHAHYGNKDGFNYHQNTSPNAAAYFVEVDCRGTHNGTGSSDNGTTAHEAFHGLRLNGVYVLNNSRNLHDVHTSRTANFGCVAGLSVSSTAGQDVAFNVGQGGLSAQAGAMWLIDCVSLGGGANVIDYYAAELSTLWLIGASGQQANDNIYTDPGATLKVADRTALHPVPTPSLTTTERDNRYFSDGTHIYNRTTGRFEGRENGQWVPYTATVGLQYIVDGGGSVITTGLKGFLEVPAAMVVEKVTLLADQTGSVVVDLWKDTFANYPPDVSDTITASDKPTISAAQASANTTLTGWDTALAAGDVIAFNIDSVSGIERLVISITGRRA